MKKWLCAAWLLLGVLLLWDRGAAPTQAQPVIIDADDCNLTFTVEKKAGTTVPGGTLNQDKITFTTCQFAGDNV